MDRIAVRYTIDGWSVDVRRRELWHARDSLQGRFAADRANQDVLVALGLVLFAMGDLPQAGRYWWLTERFDEDARAARAAFNKRYGANAAAVLHALPRPTHPELYPDSVRIRLEELVRAYADEGGRWSEQHWRDPAAPPQDAYYVAGDVAWSRRDRLRIGLIAGVVFVATMGVWAVGLIAIVAWIVRRGPSS